VRGDVPNLRRHRALSVLRTALQACAQRADFRVVEFALLGNHLHMVAEAAGAESLGRGMLRLGVRLARGWNRVHARRGTVFAERYHVRALSSPRQVRTVLSYVLCNARRHAERSGVRLASRWVDPFSSGPWFDGWMQRVCDREPWMRELLLTTGWRALGPLPFA
jgi:hypothetical protein